MVSFDMSEVFFSPITSVLRNMPPGTLVVGVPGAGKSYALLNIAANSLEQGANVFALDAKNDMLNLRNVFPSMKVTDVNNIAPGSLDPFLTLEKVDATTIMTIIELICGNFDAVQRSEVIPIVKDFVQQNNEGRAVTFSALATQLFRSENKFVRGVAVTLQTAAESAYGPLLFAPLGSRPRGLKFSNESRIISILGMELPSSDEHTKPDEQFNAAVVYIICKMMRDLLKKKKNGQELVDNTPTVLILDELHMLLRSEAIASVVDELLVLGRSLRLSIILASQNVTHFPKGIAQYVSSKMCFRLSKREASEFFAMFDISNNGKELDTGETIDLATRLKTGYCFYMDLENRCSLVHITSQYPVGAFSSNFLEKNEYQMTTTAPSSSIKIRS
jgi:hypothetical protein